MEGGRNYFSGYVCRRETSVEGVEGVEGVTQRQSKEGR